MKKVGIVMGSDSDMPVMSKAAAILDTENRMCSLNMQKQQKKRDSR